MALRLGLLGAAALLGTVSFGYAAEEVVEIATPNGSVVGTLETPAGDPAPVVLMLHGFTGSRDELQIAETDEGVFSRTARQLADAGFASLRIDFRGSGESVGEGKGAWAETTFSGQTADALAVIDWLAGQDAVDGETIAVLGWSQGGLVAAHAVAGRPDVAAAVLLAPVVNPYFTYTAILGDAPLEAALSSAPDTPITAKLPWGEDTVLNAAFFQEFATTSTAAALAEYPGPLFVIVGLKDTVVAPQPASGELLLRYHDGPEQLMAVDADHVWNAFTGPDMLDDSIVPAIVDWLRQNL